MMYNFITPPPRHIRTAVALALLLAGACAKRKAPASTSMMTGSDGPADQGPTLPTRQDGDATLGREVFRFETFGNEGFWTDAVRLPEGMAAAKVTPLQALELGLNVNVDAVDPATKEALAAQLKQDPSGRTSAILNDPAMTTALVKANAVIGFSSRNGKVGATCALCHNMTDASVFAVPDGGSIGHEIDGPANHAINLGKIFATAANSRALYPNLQLALRANGGKSLGRAPTGLTENSTEEEVDAYLSNPAYYPVGTFDDTFDGNGNSVHNSALFRQDLAAPFATEGSIARLDNFSNLVYTSLFDLTMLTTPGGRAFVHKLAGAAGDEMVDNYVKVLSATHVTGYPFVLPNTTPHSQPGSEDAPAGVRVDNRKLLALNAYLVSLQAPRGKAIDPNVASRGRETCRTAGCTRCHNVNQGQPVPTTIHAMKEIFPGDNPVVLAQRDPPLNPVMNTVASTFDDKMSVVNASIRGEKRGAAMPLLLDLARKPVFLHDNSVPSLDALLDPSRGATAPHPFYVSSVHQRSELVQYLESLDTQSK